MTPGYLLEFHYLDGRRESTSSDIAGLRLVQVGMSIQLDGLWWRIQRKVFAPGYDQKLVLHQE
jgi:hypothetical protein